MTDRIKIFRKLPKMTNIHIHLMMIYPYKKLATLIKEIDPDLYNQFYVSKNVIEIPKCQTVVQDSIVFLNDVVIQNLPRDSFVKIDQADSSMWDQFVVKENIPNPFVFFDSIKNRIYYWAKQYKVFYYMVYHSLYANYKNNVFYLNVKGMPGALRATNGKDVFQTSRNVMSWTKFKGLMDVLIKDDKHVKSENVSFMYKLYTRCKLESDLIIRALNEFNRTGNKTSKVSDEDLLNASEHEIKFNPDRKNILIQYTLAFNKLPKNTPILIDEYLLRIKMQLYIATIINREYHFMFFNSIDFVGYEQESHDLETFLPVIEELLMFRSMGFFFTIHLGETNVILNDLTQTQKQLLSLGINRFGHGIAFIDTPSKVEYVRNHCKELILEVCPISNYLLGYYKPQESPHQRVINEEKIHVTICSDDNAVFGYSTVTQDYIAVYKAWKLNVKVLKELILNGIRMIDKKYQDYYFDLFDNLWEGWVGEFGDEL